MMIKYFPLVVVLAIYQKHTADAGTTGMAAGAASGTVAGAGGTAAPAMSGTAAMGTVAPAMAGTAAPGMAGTAAPGMAGTAAPGMAGTAAPGMAGTAVPGMAGTAAPGMAGTAAPGKGGTAAPGMSGTMSGGTAAPDVSGGSGGTTVASSGASPGTVTQTVEMTGMSVAEAQQMASSSEFKTNQRTEYANAAGNAVNLADVAVTNTASAARRLAEHLAEHMVLLGRSLSAAGKLVSVFTITVPAGVSLDSVNNAVVGAKAAIQTAMKTAVANTAAFTNITVTATAAAPTKTAAVSPTPAPANNNVGGACGSQLARLVLLAVLSRLLF